MYSRRRFIQTSVALGAGLALPFEVVSAVETGLKFEPESPLISAPRDPAAWPEFRKRLAAWREEKRRSLIYSERGPPPRRQNNGGTPWRSVHPGARCSRRCNDLKAGETVPGER